MLKDKIKDGVCVGPQIRWWIQDVKYEYRLSEVEKAAWNSLENVTTIFLVNQKAENDRDMEDEFAQSYKAVGRNMSKGAFLRFSLRLLPRKSRCSERWAQRVISPWKSGTKANRVPVCWLIIAGHLEETLHRQNVAENESLLLFK